MNKTFLGYDKPLLTAMVQGETPERIKELIDLSLPEGADAFGMQFCRLKKEYRNPEVYRNLFEYTDKPIYVTNYRMFVNSGKTDDELAEELIGIAQCGKVLCDVMGDYYDKQPDEVAKSEAAIDKQKRLIEKLHQNGSEVLMSSHVLKYTPAERVLEIALEHEKRGADICKIVVNAQSMEEQLENMRIMTMLKKELHIPFLFLSSGECKLLRRVGGELGNCMYLCVHEYDAIATSTQPLLKKQKLICDNLR